jgi:crotonobetainyl-CoA:carnitine CoA-transferase CaiB-like acyl-CoA transferase
VEWADQDDRHRVEKALRRADAVISSYYQGAFASPYDDEAVRELNPRAVHVIVSPFGVSGSYRDYPSSSLVDWAAGGYLHITGEPDRPPLPGPPDMCAYVSGYMAAIAIESGMARVRSGRPGVTLDISHMETMCSLHQAAFPRLVAGEVMTRAGNVVGPATYPHGSYPCGHGELFLGIVTDEEWDRFLIAIDRPELCDDPQFVTGAARKANAHLVDEIVTSWTGREESPERAATLLQVGKVPATACATPGDLLEDVQLEYRGYFRSVKLIPGDVTARFPGNVLLSQREQPAIGPASETRSFKRAAVSASQEALLPLAGTTVLDLSLWWAGPMAARILGDLGANVIRVERPTLGADDNAWPKWHRFVHEQMHRNKRSIVVDLTTPEGLAIVQRLITRADVLIQNYRPGAMQKLGLGWMDARVANPMLVYISLSGYGLEGPKSGWGTYGTLSEAASSVRSLTHYPGEGGMRLGDQLPDAVCGLAGALAALRGLRERRLTNSGCHFDISQLEAYVALIGEEVAAASLGDSQAEVGGGNRLEQLEGIYRCAGEDDWVAVTLPDAESVARVSAALCEATGAAPGPGVNDLLEEFAAGRSKQAVAESLRALGTAAFPVATARDLVTDPHLKARQFFQEVSLSGLTGVLPGTPIRARGPSVTALRTQAPAPGEHSIEILREDLQLPEGEIEQLLKSRVVRQRGDF